MKRMLIVLGLAVVSLQARPSEAATTLKMATLAPERSPWGKVFRAWSKAVHKKSDEAIDVVWLWNGAAGPETTAVGKIKTGQLAGAAVTATGLTTVYKPVVALQMPGAYESWAELDRTRDKLAPTLDRALRERGFVMGGWGDVGVGRLFSRGFAVHGPKDLRGKTPGYARSSLVAPKVFEAIGGVTGRPGTAGEVLGLLSSGSVDVLMTSPLAAEQLQWASRLTHLNTMALGYGVGGILLGDRALSRLSADQRKLVERTSKTAAKALTHRVRNADQDAFARLKRRLRTVEPTKADIASWKTVFEKACEKVKRSLPGDALTRAHDC